MFNLHFLPITNAFYNIGGISANRWLGIYLDKYISIYGQSSLPATTFYRRFLTVKAVAGSPDELFFCRARTAGDSKWKALTDSVASISILKEVNGITKIDIGVTDVEVLGASHRSKVDLAYLDRCRVVFGGVNNEAVVFYCKIQYSTDQITWVDLTPEGTSDGTTNEQLVVGAWGNIPVGALSDVFIRAVGRATNATADPTYKTIELQIR